MDVMNYYTTKLSDVPCNFCYFDFFLQRCIFKTQVDFGAATEHRLKAAAYLSIVSDHVHPFITNPNPLLLTHLLMATLSRIMHCHKAHILPNYFLKFSKSQIHSNGLQSHQILIEQLPHVMKPSTYS